MSTTRSPRSEAHPGLVITRLLPVRFGSIWGQGRWLFRDAFGSRLRVATALMPTLIFTMVLATILHERYGIPDALYGGLLLYAFLNTLLPSLVLRTAFDVAPMPEPSVETEQAQTPSSADPAAGKA